MQRSAPFLGLEPERVGLSRSLAADIAMIDRVLGHVLCEQTDAELLSVARALYAAQHDADPRTLLERIPRLQDPVFVQRLLRSYAVLFQLINTAEQKEIVRANRQRYAHAGGAPRPESIEQAVHALYEAGVSADDMQALIDHLEVCPTLTAHPTEARRRSVLDKLQAIGRALVASGADGETPALDGPLQSDASREAEVKRILTALWQTDELRASPLTVVDEAANTLYFIEHSILDIVAWLHEDLRGALSRHYPGREFSIGPFVRYRSWVGGDRDGNPNVSAHVTWQTLVRHKRVSLQHYIARSAVLRRELSQSIRVVNVSDELMRSLEEDSRAIALPENTQRRYRLEPYALKLVYMESRLAATLAHLDTLSSFESPAEAVGASAYANAGALVEDLGVIERSLRANSGAVLAEQGPLARLTSQVTAFGFHLAALDIRQHSEEHERAVDEMISAAHVLLPERKYSSLSEEEKVTLLTRELTNPRPLLPHDRSGALESKDVLDVFEVVLRAQRLLSPDAVTTYIISMTHGVSDVLEVLLLAKEVGLVRWSMRGGVPCFASDIDVVPLFETIDDLERCDELMRRLYEDATYRMHLEARGNFQEIMLGYSDSSKDGGFLAANATLYETQARLAKASRRAGVRVRFFHGRGGTVGRGGGRANRAILSQPAGSFDGRIRFTEQGEIVSFRYSMPALGHRHMEQIVNAALLASSDKTAQPHVKPEWLQALRQMAERSLGVYRALVHEDPEFWSFYTQATPIRYISRLPIASRPASRSRQLSGLESLRAIPWVFAWIQNRYVVPGWYGLGAALEAYAAESAENEALLAVMYREWLFFRMVINNAQLELLRAHLPTAAWYARRVQPPELGARMHERLAQEHALARMWILRITGQDELLGHAPMVRRTVELRNPVTVPLSQVQLALLDVLEREPEATRGAAWQDAMLLSITGIAAAMQSTG
ncbi:MAG: phosphoenolpyruvate carboxylase [Burkholderiales bacterium]